MSQHTQKFESSMFEYCLDEAERSYKLIEDGDIDNGLEYAAHLVDVLRILVESRNSQGVTNISEFSMNVKDLPELERDQVYSHLQENGFGQYIPE